jgi:hypothetical protein
MSENANMGSELHPLSSDRMSASPVGVAAAWLAGWTASFAMPGVIVLKWLVNVVFAGAAALPAALWLRQHLGHSAAADEAFSQVGIDTAAELAYAFEAELRLAAVAVASVALIFLFVSLYLTGGILDRLRGGGERSWASFFLACNRHVGMLIRVGVLIGLLFGGVVALPYYGLEWLVEWLTEDATWPAPVFYATWVHWAIVFVLASWVARVYDYARIVVVLFPGRNARRAVLAATSFVLRHGPQTFLLWLLLTVLPLIVLFVVATGPAPGGVRTMIAMWLSVVVGQALVVFRITGSLAAFGAEMRFLAGLRV